MANRVLWAAITGIVASAVVVTVIELDAMRPEPEPVVDLAEAEVLFNRAVHLAENKRFDEFCREIAEFPDNCRRTVQWYESIGWQPGPAPPKIVGIEYGKPGFPPVILHLTGQLESGSAYTASFGVNKDRDGRVFSWYPVYWSGVDFGPQTPRCAAKPPAHRRPYRRPLRRAGVPGRRRPGVLRSSAKSRVACPKGSLGRRIRR
ncbi:hypothetical protein [Kibdelosporangium philippinense]|uniref:hypothetical protein n=1 Tax=Kibdelosporangium philippinense TaxID=211113 RepID=UPI00361C7B91